MGCISDWELVMLSLGSLVQAALTQPASKTVNLGDTMQITCSGASADGGGNYCYVYGWFQQKTPVTAPVTVIYSNNQRPSGIPSRFSGSASGSTNTLTITGVQAEDEAVYYCGSYDSSAGGVGVSESYEDVRQLHSEVCACGPLAELHSLPSLLSLSRFPGPGSNYSAGLEVREPRRHRADHLLRE
uniref:Ig-like domain-containing protein n=1 Tax=Anas platyrhynchos platyrhynchos TaxID=8840 RepID=A0A493TP15_ANAPP